MMVTVTLSGCLSSEPTVGINGNDGSDGITGSQGPSGLDGTNGIDGTNGADGTNGIDGQIGPQGIPGESGSNGQDAIELNLTPFSNEINILQNRIIQLEAQLLSATTCQLVPWGNCPRADLSGMNLSGMDLTGINLRGATLIGTDLSGALLDKSILSDVDAWNSSFAQASIDNADLSDSRFWKNEWNDECQYCHAAAVLSGTSIIDSDMTNIYLRYADLTTTFFRGSDFDGSDLSWTDLSNQYLLQTDMTNVILNYANLTNTQFFDMNLEGSNLILAEFNNTFFSNVNLEDTSFLYSELISSTFQFCKMEDTSFLGANMDSALIYNSKLRFTDFTNSITTNMQYNDSMMNDWLLVKWSDGLVYSTTPV